MDSKRQNTCRCRTLADKNAAIANRLLAHSLTVQTHSGDMADQWLARQYQQTADFFSRSQQHQAGASSGGA